MAPKALPALVLLALVCGQLVTGGHAQAYIGGMGGTRGGSAAAGMRPLPYPYARGGGSAGAGMQPPAYARGGGSAAAGDDGTGGLSAVGEDKAFMIHRVPSARERPVPIPPTSN